ncbi:hypothetical protein NKH18_09375 [Streptomyces sp. M10(2022)]
MRGGAFVDESAPRVTFLARDGARGWAELCRLVTAAHASRAGAADAGQPMIGRSALPAEGLTVLLGPASEVGRALAAGRPDRAAALLAVWRQIYGDDLRLEAVHHGREGTGPGSLRLAARTVGFAAEQGVRAVLTNAVRYADPGRARSPMCSTRPAGSSPSTRAAPLDSGQRWLKGARAMRETAERITSAAGLGPGAGSGCWRRPGAVPMPAWSTPRATWVWAPSTSPNPGSSAPGSAPLSGYWPPARRRAWCCAATTASAGTGSGCTASWTSSPTTASPPTS